MNDVAKNTTSPRRGLNRAAVLAVVAWACAIAATAARAPARGANAASPAANAVTTAVPAERLTATVSAVDTRAGTIDLVTGVGYALRIRRIHLPREPKLEADRARAAVPALAPGSIVRVEFRQTASGAVASTVEVLQPPPRKGKP